MQKIRPYVICILLSCLVLWAALAFAGYKAHPWSLRAVTAYPAQLTSERVTITVEPLYRNEMAAEVFDSKDMVARGIMPVALGVFNENDFPVRIEAESIELISGAEHVHTMPPGEVVYRLFSQGGKKEWVSQPMPRDPSRMQLNRDALADFEQKYLGSRTIGPRSKEGGFIFIHPPAAGDPEKYLSGARVYIPGIYRQDTGQKMIFFEIDAKASLNAEPGK
jgi:hypothetical protein